MTTVGVLPAYLVGALAVQIRGDFPFDRSALGAVVAGYFAVSALASPAFGQLAERLGPHRSMRRAACLSLVALLGVGLIARSAWHVAGFLLLAGLANAAAQPAANLALARGVAPERQGLVFGIKQAAIPTATLLAGLAVPALALVVGWRWAFVAAALLAVVAAFTVPHGRSGTGSPVAAERPGGPKGGRTLDVGLRPLLVFAFAGCLGSGVANSLGVFLVEAAVSESWQPASAGHLLAVGSIASLCTRVAAGWTADRRGAGGSPGVAMLMGGGAVGLLLMSTAAGSLGVFAAGAVLAFAAGWGWPGLYYFSIVQANPRSPAAATGVVQSGVYLGGMAGPLLFGFVAQHLSYQAAWLAAGAAMLLAATAMLLGWKLLPHHATQRRSS